LLIDDPPRTWASVTEAASELVSLGFPPDKVVLLLSVFPTTVKRPTALQGHPALLLPWREWAISQKLQPDVVHQILSELLQGRCSVLAVHPVSPDCWAGERGHGRADYVVTVRERDGDREIAVRARGVGAGYFGEHCLAVAERLSEWVPGRCGLRDGVLYEAWQAPEHRLREPLTKSQTAAVARYIAERCHALRLDDDLSTRVSWRGVPWVAAETLPVWSVNIKSSRNSHWGTSTGLIRTVGRRGKRRMSWVSVYWTSWSP
jgi:hypothetical protein